MGSCGTSISKATFCAASWGSNPATACLTKGGDVHLVLRGLALVHLDTGEGEQVLDQALHAGGLLGHDGEEAALGCPVVRRGTLEGLNEADQRGERGAELVARVGDEVGAAALGGTLLGAVGQHHQHTAAIGQRWIDQADMGAELSV